MAGPFDDGVGVVGGAQRTLGAQTGQHPAGIVEHGKEHDRVGSGAQRVDVEGILDTSHPVAAVRPRYKL